MNKEDIINYYNDCKKDYRLIWRLEKVWGLHYGYFEKGDKSLSQAILKMNDQIIKNTNINEKTKILDAGCGYAGTAMYIAEKKKCHIEAITIVDEQVNTAKKVIKEKGLDKYINVSNQDFTKTTFKDNTFDVVYGIESICYAFPKEDFLKEAFRVLKPNGILIILDGYNSKEKEEYSAKEKRIMKKFANGWSFDSLESPKYFINKSKKIGFIKQEYKNITDKALKTSKILYIASFPAYVVDFVGRVFKRRTKYGKGNVDSARNQYIGLKKGLWQYGMFKAVKGEQKGKNN